LWERSPWLFRWSYFQSQLRFQPREWSSAWKLSIDDVVLQYLIRIRRINDKREGTVFFSLCFFFLLSEGSPWLFRWSYFSHSCDSNQLSDFVHEKLSIDDVFPQYLTRIRRITYKREGTVFFPCVFFFFLTEITSPHQGHRYQETKDSTSIEFVFFAKFVDQFGLIYPQIQVWKSKIERGHFKMSRGHFKCQTVTVCQTSGHMEGRPSLLRPDPRMRFFWKYIRKRNWPDTARHSRAQTGPSDSPEGHRARVSKEADLFLSFYLVWEMLLLARPKFNSKTVSNLFFCGESMRAMASCFFL
jgi:hypothetical protein